MEISFWWSYRLCGVKAVVGAFSKHLVLLLELLVHADDLCRQGLALDSTQLNLLQLHELQSCVHERLQSTVDMIELYKSQRGGRPRMTLNSPHLNDFDNSSHMNYNALHVQNSKGFKNKHTELSSV